MRKRKRTVTGHVRADAGEQVDAKRLTDSGKRVCKWWGSIADASRLVGHRLRRFRGKRSVRWQARLAATTRDIKRIPMMTMNPGPSH